MKSAVVFGASGFVGSHLLRELMESSEYGSVTAVVRKDLGLAHPKLRVVTGDYDSLPGLATEIAADEIFLALGTTKKNSPTEAAYSQVDHAYPVLAARVAKQAGAKAVFLVTAVGADPKSKFFYTRTKGETERDVIALGFEHTHIFRPSMILGPRKERRSLLEAVMMKLWSALNPVLRGRGERYKGMAGKEIARAMLQAAKQQAGTLTIYTWREMQNLLQR